MSTVRRDPLTGELVVVAPRRIPAPPAFGRGTLPRVPVCPFCPGEEQQTEPELDRLPVDGPWSVRAFPNRRPGLHLETDARPLGEGPLHGHGGRGAHEVLALGREHGRLTVHERYLGLELAARRLADLSRDPRFAALGWFRNRGVEAGASQAHDHAQLVALASVPPRLERILAVQEADLSLVPDLLTRAREEGRVVAELDGVVAFCPWAPASPFAVRLVPLAPASRWTDETDVLEPLAHLLHGLTAALDRFSGFTATNTIGWFAPPGRTKRGVRWVVELLPRVVPVAGFERWSGGAMHPIDPVVAAAMLRDAVA